MKHLLSFTVALFTLASCSSVTPTPAQVSLENVQSSGNDALKPFPLTYKVVLTRLEPIVKLSEFGLEFELLDIRDARCPAPVRCVWAGNAEVDFAVRSLNWEKQPYRKYTLNTDLAPRNVVVDRFYVTIQNVFPYPGQTTPHSPLYPQGVTLEVRPLIR